MTEGQYRRREFLKYAAKIGMGGVAALTLADRLFPPVQANTQIAFDNFTGTDANPRGGPWTTATGFQPIQRLSNTGRGTSNSLASAAYWNANAFLSGVYSEFAMTTKVSGSSACLFARAAADLSSGYEILFNGTFGASAIGQIKKADGTALPSNPSAFVTTINSGDIVRLSCQGTAITMLVNGVPAPGSAPVRDYLFQSAGLSGTRLVPGTSVNDIQLTDWASGFEGDSRFVQEIPFGLDTPPQSVETVTPNVISGNLMVVFYGSGDQTLQPVVTSPGDTWNVLPVQFSHVFTGFFFWAKAVTGGAKTITVTKNAGAGAGHMACTYGEYNFKNAALSSTPVVNNGASGTISATITGAGAGDLLIAYASCPTGNPPVLGLNGMAFRGGGPLGQGLNPTGAFDEIGLFDGTASAGSNTATLTGVGAPWEMILASFSGQAGFGGSVTAGPTKAAGPTVKQ